MKYFRYVPLPYHYNIYQVNGEDSKLNVSRERFRLEVCRLHDCEMRMRMEVYDKPKREVGKKRKEKKRKEKKRKGAFV
jgi:hypothetical protein